MPQPHVKSAPRGKTNRSSDSIAGGRTNSKSEDGNERGAKFGGWNKSGKREGRQGSMGPRGRRSDGVPRLGAEKNVSGTSGFDRRKRKVDDDSWDDDVGKTSAKPGFTKKSASTGRFSARKGDRLKSQNLGEDGSHSDRRSNRKVSDTSGGVRRRLVRGKNVEAPKWKKSDEFTDFRLKRGGAKDAGSDEQAVDGKNSDESGSITEEKKPHPRLTRVLDQTGKKVKPSKKDIVLDSEEPAIKKKRKRMKLDPYDTSNKRIDESLPKQDGVNSIFKGQPVSNAEKILEKRGPDDPEMSINATFRAIQPSSLFLSYVEDNLLGRRRLNEIKNAGYNVKISAPLDNVPFSTSTERERIEESVFRNKLEFFAAAKISSSFPPATIPEIAFAGVSNVGKSSLLNALTRQWGIVRTSDKPGLTQSINFFRLASKLCLVDLPGYGFAYAKDEVKESWQELVKEYVSTRVGLERVCLLVHTKRGMKPLDYELVDLMERHKTPYQIVLTKTDLVFPIDVARRAMEIKESLRKNKSMVNPVMMVSSKTGAGIRNLRGVLGKLARFIKP